MSADSEEERRRKTKLEDRDRNYALQGLNKSMLDKLVLNFLVSEGCITPIVTDQDGDTQMSENVSSSSSVLSAHCLMQNVKYLLLEGSISDALKLLQSNAEIDLALAASSSDGSSSSSGSYYLLLSIRLQQFIENMKQACGNINAYLYCIEFAYEFIYPLIASDELAFGEFHRVVPLLLCTSDISSIKDSNNALDSEIREICSYNRREKLAQEVQAFLVQTLGVQEPIFGLLLRHLVASHMQYHLHNNIPFKYPEIEEKYLLPDREPQPPTSRRPSPPGFQVNTERLGYIIRLLSIPISEAQNALQNSKNNFEEAFKSELCRIRLNRDYIIPLALDYCYFHGLLYHGYRETDRAISSKSHDGSSSSLVDPGFASKMRDISAVRDLVLSGYLTEAIKRIQALAPEFFYERAEMLYYLHTIEFLYSVKRGEFSAATDIASTHLAPSSSYSLEAMDAFKDIIIVLAFATSEEYDRTLFAEVERKYPKLEDLAQYIRYALIACVVGSEEPLLASHVRYMLYSHSVFFSSDDPADDMLYISELKHGPPLATSIAVVPHEGDGSVDLGDESESDGEGGRPSNLESSTSSNVYSSASSTGGDEESDDEEEEARPRPTREVSENSINMLQEMMRLPRERAIELLRRFGSVEAAIEHLFAGH